MDKTQDSPFKKLPPGSNKDLDRLRQPSFASMVALYSI